LLLGLACALLGERLLRCTDFLWGERLAVGGLLGLGGLGWMVGVIGIVGGPTDVAVLIPFVAAGLFGVLYLAIARVQPPAREETPTISIGFGAAFASLALIPLVGALSPPDALEWDSLAYHLAVPKLWLSSNSMAPIEFIHQSYFPFALDNLFLIGLAHGGEALAKGFSFVIFLLGALAVNAIARRWRGVIAGRWAALLFMGCPLVLWQSGTAYIDVGHGLFAALGALYALEWATRPTRGRLMIAALLLGLACSSKYTGFQAVVAVGFVVLAAASIRIGVVSAIKAVVMVGFVAVVLASPWLVRNAVVTGNPVYPFFYERFGGERWDAFRAEIYRDEQQTFGVGRLPTGRDPLAIGHAVFGLAYQPGRYINPGQTRGEGFPMGAVGGALIVVACLALARGGLRAEERMALAVAGVSLAMWFFLSQQSRYILSLAPLLAVVGAAAMAPSRFALWRSVAGFVIAAQALYSFWMVGTLVSVAQLPVVLGRVDRQEWMAARIPLAARAKAIKAEVGPQGKVALYDEVFGYVLDVRYEWANPGHPTRIPYPNLTDGAGLVDALLDLGFTHVYVNLGYQEPSWRERLGAALMGRARLTPDELARLAMDRRTHWQGLLAEAVALGRARPTRAWQSRESVAACLLDLAR
jgi:hypothetical protein